MKVPLLDLKAQYQSIKPEIDAAVQRVIESQYFILGPDVEKFERAVAEYSGCRHAIGVTSGSDAILVALMALDIGPDDEVILPSYTFFATAGSVARLGARPVFADVNPDTYNVDPASIESLLTSKTKAIIPVHLYGQVCDMKAILGIAEKRGVPVIEDAAQAIGAECDGARAGSFGKAGCFSFFPSKNLGGFGDGGMVVTNDDALAAKIRILRAHGSEPKYYHKIIGGNFRLDALQAAVLDVKLKHLDEWTRARRGNADDYDRLFKEAGLAPSKLKLPVRANAGHIFNQYVVRAERRNQLRDHLKKQDIGTEIYYPVPLHLQECFAYLGGKKGDCPRSELAAETTMAIPIYPELTAEQKSCVVSSVAEFYGIKPLSSHGILE